MAKSTARKLREKRLREGRPDCTAARGGQHTALSLHERRTKTAAERKTHRHKQELLQLQKQWKGRTSARADDGFFMYCREREALRRQLYIKMKTI
ncbi:hypothetical protein [Ectobacillus ponti]|uniref:Uncharacterized protein n=1 Tax=Ectobacillus ponti TaxID=2961894 RepID=A0AA41XDD8_9BACI|nr:hypothetical protein [Ectobacillus ponti]MCP8970830.1 hypothetical protein [Ectobacillus ponti]